MDSLIDACRDLDHTPGLLNNDHARQFFTSFPLDSLFGAFQSGVMQQMDLQTVIAVLSRLLETETGSSMLISAVPYLDAAVQSPVVPLRRLAAQQYSAMLILSQQSHPGSGSGSVPATSDRQLRHHAVSQLLAALQDKDTGVAVEAEAGLSAWAVSDVAATEEMLLPHPSVSPKTEDAMSHLCVLSLASGSTSSTVRMRLLSMLASVAARGGRLVTAAVKHSGLAHSLLVRELSASTKDPLSALSALSAVSELASGRGELAGQMLSAVLDALPTLLGDPMLRPGALGAAALLLRETLDEAAGSESSMPTGLTNGQLSQNTPNDQNDQGRQLQGGAVDGHAVECGRVPTGGRILLDGIRRILDDTGEDSPEDEVAALDAAGQLALSRRGAELILGDGALTSAILERAVGRASSSSEVRVAALHTLALLAGLQRAHDGEERKAAFLSVHSEEALRESTYQAASTVSLSRSPPEALLPFMEQPFQELREAAFHAVAALCLRPWFAADVCRCEALMERILDPSSETGSVAASWRYSLVTTLWSTIQAVSRLDADDADGVFNATLSAAAGRVKAACEAGPFGSGLKKDLTGHDVPMVAIMQ